MHILIVEDEEELARNLKKLLEHKRFGVDWLASPEKARTRVLLYRSEYDLIILDLALPGMSGTAFTKGLRAEGITTPIIIVTGNSDTKNKRELLNSGADDYVVKPFSPDELIGRERFDHVIVRTAVEKLSFIFCITVARDDDDGRGDTFRAQTFGKGRAAHAGEREVENYKVVLTSIEQNAGTGFFGARKPVNAEALVLQELL